MWVTFSPNSGINLLFCLFVILIHSYSSACRTLALVTFLPARLWMKFCLISLYQQPGLGDVNWKPRGIEMQIAFSYWVAPKMLYHQQFCISHWYTLLQENLDKQTFLIDHWNQTTLFFFPIFFYNKNPIKALMTLWYACTVCPLFCSSRIRIFNIRAVKNNELELHILGTLCKNILVFRNTYHSGLRCGACIDSLRGPARRVHESKLAKQPLFWIGEKKNLFLWPQMIEMVSLFVQCNYSSWKQLPSWIEKKHSFFRDIK